MSPDRFKVYSVSLLLLAALVFPFASHSEKPNKRSSYSPVVMDEDFASTMARLSGEKPRVMEQQRTLLRQRYDLGDRPAEGVAMARGKPVQQGIRVKLPSGTTWDKLAAMTPEEIKAKGLFPAGFMPLPHPKH